MDDALKLRAKSDSKLWEALKPLARQMRHDPTEAENHLWQRLRNNSLGTKFRRQHTIDRFIVDFYSAKSKLVIEVDGAVHDYSKEEDMIRQQFLELACGLRVLRFKNEEVLENTEAVLEGIRKAIIEALDENI